MLHGRAALAKNMQGYASFARLLGDASAEMQQVLQELKVLEVSRCSVRGDCTAGGMHV